MAQPNYNDTEQERIQKEVYTLLLEDGNLHLTDGVMNYIARQVSYYVLKCKRRKQ